MTPISSASEKPEPISDSQNGKKPGPGPELVGEGEQGRLPDGEQAERQHDAGRDQPALTGA